MNWPADTATSEILSGSRGRSTSAENPSYLGFSLSSIKSGRTEVTIDRHKLLLSVLYLLSVDDVLYLSVRGAI